MKKFILFIVFSGCYFAMSVSFSQANQPAIIEQLQSCPESDEGIFDPAVHCPCEDRNTGLLHLSCEEGEDPGPTFEPEIEGEEESENNNFSDEPEFDPADLTIYPNPGRPTLANPMVIMGLPNDASARIHALRDPGSNLIQKLAVIDGRAYWHGLNRHQERVAPGVYILVVESQGQRTLRKVLVRW